MQESPNSSRDNSQQHVQDDRDHISYSPRQRQELGGLLQNLETVQKGNTGIELSDGFFTFSNLTPTYVFLFLHFAVRILPYVLDIIVVFLARKLLAAMKEDLYQEESVKLAEKQL